MSETEIFDSELSGEQEAIISGGEPEPSESPAESSDADASTREQFADEHEADIFGPAEETPWLDEAFPASEAQVKSRAEELGLTDKGTPAPAEKAAAEPTGPSASDYTTAYQSGNQILLNNWDEPPNAEDNPEGRAAYDLAVSSVQDVGLKAYFKSAADFQKTHPDFPIAYEHGRKTYEAEVKAANPGATDAQISQQFRADELEFVDNVLNSGRDPAQAMYDYARGKGFQSSAGKLANIQRGQDASRSGSSGGGGGADDDESVAGLLKNWDKNFGSEKGIF